MSNILDPVRFVAARKVLGGPAPKTVRTSIRRHLKWNADQSRWLDKHELSLQRYPRNLAKLNR
jgi:hypothetical protein